ncbi:DMT family transporter [Falsigemmobacter intermedius]|uniref:DMT family transporter n=1 Tax=Falsigemmobacter intermedius TaxID=1553448 RepID=A0A3S3YRK6_9RHOB|nr:DMT family transporter [Falsigemmobacter intermedius]RWY44705.1 DMT family transporter [Falsigemmobacter intermedius]
MPPSASPPQTPEYPQSRPLVAVAWMAGTVLSFLAVTISARELSGQLDVSELLLYRALVGVVVLGGAVLLSRRLATLRTRAIGRHVLRNSIHYIGQLLWYQALVLIPIAQLYALEFTTPIWVLLLSFAFLGERLNAAQILAALVGFTGVLVVARPDFSDLSYGVVAGSVCAIFFAIYALMTRAMTRTDTAQSLVFWQVAMQVPLGLIVAGHDLQIALPQGIGWLWMVVMGLGGLGAHFCIAKALMVAPASFVYPLDYVRLPLGVIAGFLIYAEQIELAVFLGAALILLGNWINIRYGAKRPRSAG